VARSDNRRLEVEQRLPSSFRSSILHTPRSSLSRSPELELSTIPRLPPPRSPGIAIRSFPNRQSQPLAQNTVVAHNGLNLASNPLRPPPPPPRDPSPRNRNAFPRPPARNPTRPDAPTRNIPNTDPSTSLAPPPPSRRPCRHPRASVYFFGPQLVWFSNGRHLYALPVPHALDPPSLLPDHPRSPELTAPHTMRHLANAITCATSETCTYYGSNFDCCTHSNNDLCISEVKTRCIPYTASCNLACQFNPHNLYCSHIDSPYCQTFSLQTGTLGYGCDSTPAVGVSSLDWAGDVVPFLCTGAIMSPTVIPYTVTISNTVPGQTASVAPLPGKSSSAGVAVGAAVGAVAVIGAITAGLFCFFRMRKKEQSSGGAQASAAAPGTGTGGGPEMHAAASHNPPTTSYHQPNTKPTPTYDSTAPHAPFGQSPYGPPIVSPGSPVPPVYQGQGVGHSRSGYHGGEGLGAEGRAEAQG
jgi:hypothetical protein